MYSNYKAFLVANGLADPVTLREYICGEMEDEDEDDIGKKDPKVSPAAEEAKAVASVSVGITENCNHKATLGTMFKFRAKTSPTGAAAEQTPTLPGKRMQPEPSTSSSPSLQEESEKLSEVYSKYFNKKEGHKAGEDAQGGTGAILEPEGKDEQSSTSTPVSGNHATNGNAS